MCFVLRNGTCALEPWALQVLRNQAARRARRPRWTSTDPELDQIEDAASVHQTNAERREVRQHLRACIESLPEPYRGTLIERFYASRSVGDIAANYGLPMHAWQPAGSVATIDGPLPEGTPLRYGHLAHADVAARIQGLRRALESELAHQRVDP